MAKMLLVVVLLTSGGLIYPPSLALKCYHCDGFCTRSNQVTETCDPAFPDCVITSEPGHLKKSCGRRNPVFDCIQKELRQRGDCYWGSLEETLAAHQKCIMPTTVTSDVIISDDKRLQIVTNAEALRQIKQGGMYVACTCSKDFCNTEDILEETNGGSGAIKHLKSPGILFTSGMFLLLTRLN